MISKVISNIESLNRAKWFQLFIFTMIISLSYPVRSQQLFSFDHNGLNRQYYLHIPDSLMLGAPLVFVFHGYGGSAISIMDYSNMNATADENMFVVCYPQGTLDDYGNAFWNVGYEFHSNETVDDIGFIRGLSEQLEVQYQLSKHNIFGTGMSNGGDLSYMLACNASDRFQAVAPVAGTMMTHLFLNCQPEQPMSVFEIHGTDDDVTLWEGDHDNSEGWGSYLDIPSIIDLWVEINQCESISIDTLDNTNENDESYVISERSYDCINDNEVKLFKIMGGGHDWPGSYGNMDIHSNQEIWKFFDQNIQEEVVGDVNFDLSLDILDILYISNTILDNEQYYFLFDFNNDQSVDIMDIISLAQFILQH